MKKTFTSTVRRSESGLRFHYLEVPDEILKWVTKAGHRRVILDLAGVEHKRAIQGRVNETAVIVVGQDILRTVRAREDDEMTLQISIDPDPDFIDLCDEFQAVLDTDEEAAAKFFAFTRGKQRSLAYYANSAKRSETRIKRGLELAEKIRTNTLHGDSK